jgi:hypothetical protein
METTDKQEEHLGEQYILGARAPMGDAGWHGPWDCAEFASWCVFQASGILFGVQPRHDPMLADAYTGYWGEQARADSAMITPEAAAARWRGRAGDPGEAGDRVTRGRNRMTARAGQRAGGGRG